LLYSRGVSLDACFDVLNLNNPRVVQSIHADSIGAGAYLMPSFGRFEVVAEILDAIR
jgi:methionine synthase I (cobalamin-dependent)